MKAGAWAAARSELMALVSKKFLKCSPPSKWGGVGSVGWCGSTPCLDATETLQYYTVSEIKQKRQNNDKIKLENKLLIGVLEWV